MSFSAHSLANKKDIGESWRFMEKKVDMLGEELESYSEIQIAFEDLECLYEENLRRKKEVSAELEQIVQSPQTSYGFFSRTTKEDKIAEKTKEGAELDSNLVIHEQLLALISEVYIRHEMKEVKDHRKKRFEQILNNFSNAKIDQLEKELAFWKMAKTDASEEDSRSGNTHSDKKYYMN